MQVASAVVPTWCTIPVAVAALYVKIHAVHMYTPPRYVVVHWCRVRVDLTWSEFDLLAVHTIFVLAEINGPAYRACLCSLVSFRSRGRKLGLTREVFCLYKSVSVAFSICISPPDSLESLLEMVVASAPLPTIVPRRVSIGSVDPLSRKPCPSCLKFSCASGGQVVPSWRV